MQVCSFNVGDGFCVCLFCGESKRVGEMKSFQRGRKSMRRTGICMSCFARLRVR